MNEFHTNLWAPWRMEYIHSLSEPAPSTCFLCDYANDPAMDDAHHVLWRTESTLALMNRFPYTNGHLLLAPRRHIGDLNDLSPQESTALWQMMCDAQRLLQLTVQAQGFNIGLNLGKCAGAGLPDHVHFHVVPRWSGDTNFMAVIGDVRVIPESLNKLFTKLREDSAKLALPRQFPGAAP